MSYIEVLPYTHNKLHLAAHNSISNVMFSMNPTWTPILILFNLGSVPGPPCLLEQTQTDGHPHTCQPLWGDEVVVRGERGIPRYASRWWGQWKWHGYLQGTSGAHRRDPPRCYWLVYNLCSDKQSSVSARSGVELARALLGVSHSGWASGNCFIFVQMTLGLAHPR